MDTSIDFPKGFILTRKTPRFLPDNFVNIPALAGLYVHPDLRVSTAFNDRGWSLVVLGTCLDTRLHSTAASGFTSTAQLLITALEEGREHFFETLAGFTGRFLILHSIQGRLTVIPDAAASKPAFYSDDGATLASHAALVHYNTSPDTLPSKLPFRFGYPGLRTPYPTTRILTANTYMDMKKGTLHRHWPLRAMEERNVETVAASVTKRTTTALRLLALSGPLRIALTAGLDSRVLLSILMASGCPFEAYTYGSGRDTAIDRAVAGTLASEFGFSHSIIPQRSPTDSEIEYLSQINFSPSSASSIPGLSQWFEDPTSYAVSANLLEIGYMNYAPHRSRIAPPTTPRSLAKLHWSSQGDLTRKAIADYGASRYAQQSAALFQEFMIKSGFEDTFSTIPPWNGFYWEHRMSTWFGPLTLERDIYSEPLVPFNCHHSFQDMLSIPANSRDDASVLKAIIEMNTPELITIPINPPNWP